MIGGGQSFGVARGSGGSDERIVVPQIEGCSRCGGDHEDVTFVKLSSPIGDMTHWTTCPKIGEPILLAVTGQIELRGDE